MYLPKNVVGFTRANSRQMPNQLIFKRGSSYYGSLFCNRHHVNGIDKMYLKILCYYDELRLWQSSSCLKINKFVQLLLICTEAISNRFQIAKTYIKLRSTGLKAQGSNDFRVQAADRANL